MFKCELMFSNQSSYLGAVSILGYYLHPAGRVDVSAGLVIFAVVPGKAGRSRPPPTIANCRKYYRLFLLTVAPAQTGDGVEGVDGWS